MSLLLIRAIVSYTGKKSNLKTNFLFPEVNIIFNNH